MAKKIIKILQIQPEYNVKKSDTADLAEQIVKSLQNAGHEVTSAYIYGVPLPGQPESIAKHIKYFNFKKTDLSGFRLKVLWALYRFCSERKFDVIICNRFKIASLLLQLNKLLQVPLCIGISHVMDEYRRCYRRLQIKLLANSRWKFVGVSDAVKERLISHNIGFTENNTYSITNAIDIEQAEQIQLTKKDAREALGLPENAIIIGAIGQLITRKGHRYLISALAELEKTFPNVHLCIIGGGPEIENLKKQVLSLGLQGKVHLAGFRSEALQYVRAFDIWAMPSISEGLGLALLEGMSGRLPVIASNIPAMLPIIEGGGGISVCPKDLVGLTAALRSYLQLTPEERSFKGEYAYDYLKKSHSIQEYRKQYLQLVESI